jgi:hypothetical protein
MSLTLAGFCLRTDLAGVSSGMRALALQPKAYQRPLHLGHGPALELERLTGLWVRWVLRLFTPVRGASMHVWVGDGLKAPAGTQDAHGQEAAPGVGQPLHAPLHLLPHFLMTTPSDHDLKKFLLDNMDPGRCTPLLIAA